AKYGKGVGQVALRHLIDSGVVVIPKSTKPERMAENIDVFDFELTSEDHAAVDALDTDHSVCYDHTDLTVVKGLLGFIKSTM
ncbi:MAG: aldo/keto reductase, partial [Coriobacteriia bacterium]|nr:aldo/keto reductase [Coriobacteriia bacterium]